MNGTTRKRRMMSYTGSILAVVLGGLVVFFAADRSPAQGQGALQQGKAGEQMHFQTPDGAVNALSSDRSCRTRGPSCTLGSRATLLPRLSCDALLPRRSSDALWANGPRCAGFTCLARRSL